LYVSVIRDSYLFIDIDCRTCLHHEASILNLFKIEIA